VTISGSPTVSGTYNYVVIAQNGCGTASITGSITVVTSNTLTLSSVPSTGTQTVCIATALDHITYSTTGATGVTIAGLPAGLTTSWTSPTATISGLPTAAGVSTYTVTTLGGCGVETATGSIVVSALSSISASSPISPVCVGTPITNMTYTTTGATGASIVGLPTGMTTNWTSPTATISGSPMVAGVSTYTVTTLGGCGSETATGVIAATASNTLTLTSATSTADQSIAFNASISNISYSTTATGVSVIGLPAGITSNWSSPSVSISGSATASGVSTYTVTTVGGCGTMTATGRIIVRSSIGTADPILPYCAIDTIINLHDHVQGESMGGVWSSQPSITIGSDGRVDLSNVNPGAYTISYSFGPDSLFFELTISQFTANAGPETTVQLCGSELYWLNLQIKHSMADSGGYWTAIREYGEGSPTLDHEKGTLETHLRGVYKYVYTVTTQCDASIALYTVVVDTLAPTIVCPGDVTVEAYERNVYKVNGEEFNAISVSDSCGLYIVYNSLNKENSLADYKIEGSTSIEWWAMDMAGNISESCRFRVTVIDNIIPNMFTPNNDGINDTWDFNLQKLHPTAIVTIFNRWGQRVYISNQGYTEKWDGRHMGKDQAVDGYQYVITENGKVIYKGTVTIMR